MSKTIEKLNLIERIYLSFNIIEYSLNYKQFHHILSVSNVCRMKVFFNIVRNYIQNPSITPSITHKKVLIVIPYINNFWKILNKLQPIDIKKLFKDNGSLFLILKIKK